MAFLFFNLFLICLLMFLLGIINSKWTLLKGKEKTRRKVGIYFSIPFLVFFLFAISGLSNEQENKKEILPAITWDWTYGGGNNESASSIIQTTDGGYAVAGSTDSEGAGESDSWVIKLDEQGKMVWDWTYEGSGYNSASSIIQTTDGGYAVAGSTDSKGAGESDSWVIKLDEQGKVVWDWTYGGSGFEQASSIIQTTDGGYAVAGSTDSKGAGQMDFWVIKLDEQGKMVWDWTYGGSGYDMAFSLVQTTDGGYAVAGSIFSKGASEIDFWVIKLDEQGKMVWDRTYGGSGFEQAFSLIQTTGGGYAVAGSILSKDTGKMDFWVIKLDEQGKMVWDWTYGGGNNGQAFSLIQTTGGGYAVAGSTTSKGAGEMDFWLIKLDEQGKMVWDWTYGGSNNDQARSLIQTTDGGYAVAGWTTSKGAGEMDFWVIKLDENGNLNK
jgi:hypothetical protein